MQDPEEISIKVKHLTEDAIKYMVSGDNKRAFENYRDAFKLSVNVGTPQQVLSCACNYGASCLVNDRADEAIELLEEYLHKVVDAQEEDTNFFTLIGDVHYNLALAYNVKYQFDLAISHLNSAVKIFKELHVVSPLAESYQQLGDVFAKAGKRQAALEAYRHAAKTFRENKDKVAEGKCYMKLAKMHLEAKERDEAVTQLKKCEKICAVLIQNDQKFGTSKRFVYDLAMLFKKAKETDKVVEWLQTAEDVDLPSKPTNEEVNLHAVIVQNLGKMFIETRNYISAVEKYRKAAAYLGQLGNTKHRAWCFYHLGGIFLTLKDSRNAEKNYHVAYQMLEDEGNISHLWKVKEGLGDLHTVTYQYSAAVTYYKEALALIGIQSSRNVIRDQRRIVDKLTAVLDSQKNGGKRDIHISYNDRRPVVLPMSYESSLEYSSIGLPPVPSKVNGPITSTPVGADGKRSKRRSSKREKAKKGRKRSDLLTAPVPNGVGEYDSGSDLSLVEREMRRQLSLSCFLGARRSHSLPKDLENTYEDPTGSDEGKPSLLQRSASQEELRKGTKKNGWRIFGKKRSGSSSDSSSSSSGLETVSVKSHSQSTSGTQTIPLYATIDRKKTGEMTANFFTGTGGEISSTIPSRWAPDPPEVPPTLPPNHPSFIERNNHPSGSSEGGQEYPETTIMNNLSRSQREAELYEVARGEQEFWKQQDHSPHHEYMKQVERRRSSVRNSRMCLVM